MFPFCAKVCLVVPSFPTIDTISGSFVTSVQTQASCVKLICERPRPWHTMTKNLLLAIGTHLFQCDVSCVGFRLLDTAWKRTGHWEGHVRRKMCSWHDADLSWRNVSGDRRPCPHPHHPHHPHNKLLLHHNHHHHHNPLHHLHHHHPLLHHDFARRVTCHKSAIFQVWERAGMEHLTPPCCAW